MRLSGRVTSWRLLGRPAAPGTAGVAFAAQLLPGPPREGAGPVGAAWRGLRPSRAREEGQRGQTGLAGRWTCGEWLGRA